MAEDIQLNHPDLRAQYEHNDLDAYLRNLKVLRNYSKLNNFRDKLDVILKRYGGDELVELQPENKPGQGILPSLKQAIDTAQIELEDEIEGARKGVMPFTEEQRYRFIDEDGRRINFVLNPDERINRTLQKFEDLLGDLSTATGEKIEAEFMPVFTGIRQEMMKWGWERKEASAQATLLTIKQLCDTWSEGAS